MNCGVKLEGTAPPMSLPSGSTLSEVQPAAPLFSTHGQDLPRPSALFAVLLAMVGAVFGILGAAQTELHALLLAPFIWAPVAEELFKPAGVYIMLIKWPGALKSQFYTAVLCALAGLAFGLVESTVYMKVYFPQHTQAELVFRFTVPVVLHTVASFIFGLGINRQLLAPLTGRGGFRRSNWAFFLTAIMLHSTYNIVVTIFM